MRAKKKIAILGSTGSIGRQAIDIIKTNPDLFEAEILTANNNADLLIKQANELNPNVVVIANDDHYNYVKEALSGTDIKVFAGFSSISEVVKFDSVDIVLAAMVGVSGLIPVVEAIKARKRIALANKETLVVAGHIIQDLVLNSKAEVIPVDSEHSAIFQCLAGESHNEVEKIILTASGGPFRGLTKEEMSGVTIEDALKHPTWNMGSKITVDSATMMNKGLEVIEARWLFNVPYQNIEVVVHPQSIIHSMVQFTDGSIKAQMSPPDMRLPIQYSFTFPDRYKSEFKRYDFLTPSALSFEPPDLQKFPCLALTYKAMERGLGFPCVMNAANEVAVDFFIKQKIKFLDIPFVVEKSMETIPVPENPLLTELVEIDKETREFVKSIL